MNFPQNLKYTNEHEWIRVEGDIAYVGITDYAQEQLGDIVFVDIPTVGETLEAGEVFGTIEVVKTISDLFLPVAGEVIELNEALEENPELANYIAKLILNQKLSPEKIVNVVKENPRFSKISLTKQTIYHSIITGKIPGVTKDSLRTEASTIFSNGQICIPKWVLEALKLKDGDVLDLNLKENGEIVYKKRGT